MVEMDRENDSRKSTMKTSTGLTKDKHVPRVILNEADCLAIISRMSDSWTRTDLQMALKEAQEKARKANLQMEQDFI